MQEQRITQYAIIASLLLHLVLVAVLRVIPDDFAPTFVPEDTERTIEFLLEDPPEEEKSRTFVNVPDRLASEEPPETDEEDQKIAMHHSLAADNVVGGDSDTPAADVQSDVDQVDIRKENPAEGGGVQEAPLAVAEASEAAEAEEQEAAEGEEVDPAGEWAMPTEEVEVETGSEVSEETKEGPEEPEFEDWWNTSQPSVLKEGEESDPGDEGYEFDQAATSQSMDGVAVVGDFRMNTTEWEYAPWMRKFSNLLYANWWSVVPPARKMGLISGWTELRITISQDGILLGVEVLDKEGHDSLHSASEAVIRLMAPFPKLPDGFPAEVLVLTGTLAYPEPLR